MPEAEEIGMFVHFIGLAVLAAGMGLELAIITMMRRAKGARELRIWSGLGQSLDDYKVMPAAVLILILSGGYLVNKVGEEWSEGWIAFSTLAVVIASALGVLVIVPRLRSIGVAAGPTPDGPIPQAVADKVNDPILIAAVYGNAMMAVAIIWNMAIHPGSLGALLTIVVLAAIGVAFAYPAYQKRKA